MTEEYRPDIDGLRALSVLSVLTFHLGTGVPGGYVGVDIFFVISGFLITSILYGDIVVGRFSILGFYDRRFRRILPALLVVLLTTLVAGAVMFLPDEFSRLAVQTAYAAFGVSNFYFLFNSGYFDAAASQQPLLHTWSLAVEEQFYLVWPFALALLAKFAKGRESIANRWLLGVIIALSLTASVIITPVNQTFAFYMLPTRAFELALGGILAFLPQRTGSFARYGGVVGLIIVLGTVIYFNESMAFPGMLALLPSVGAALVIWPRTEPAAADRVLTLKPVVYLGKISYSLYLWHWPLIILARRMVPQGGLTLWAQLAVALLALVLADFTWRFIEQPFRLWRPASRVSVSAGLIGTSVVAAVAAVIVVMAGFPGRLTEAAANLAGFKYDYRSDYREGTCFLRPEQGAGDVDIKTCLPEKVSLLVWGDSYAAHYYPALKQLFSAPLGQLSASGCPPIVDFVSTSRPNCKGFNDFAIQHILQRPPKVILLSGNWYSYQFDLGALDKTIERLRGAGIKVVIAGQSPNFDTPVPELLAKRLQSGNASTYSDDDLTLAARLMDAKMSAHYQANQIYISVFRPLCPKDRCALTANGRLIYWDRGHLTIDGALLFAGTFIKKLKDDIQF